MCGQSYARGATVQPLHAPHNPQDMRVLLVNTSERTGGAAIAAARLCEALGNNGVKARMLVSRKETGLITVSEPHNRLRHKLNFLWERLTVFAANKFRRHRLFEVDAANCGSDITALKEFREADVVHLHWINQGFISLAGISKILRSGKPVVWTMHDMWPFTGICHYNGTCERYKESCGNCPVLYGGGSEGDLSHRVFMKKLRLFDKTKIAFVGCSDWLTECARNSRLLNGKNVLSIPNPINTRLYCPGSKETARKALSLPAGKKLLLFAAFRVTNKIKGIDYLCEAIRIFSKNNPDLCGNTALVAVGKEAEALAGTLPVEVYPLGYIASERKMIEIYNACDLFLIPTLQDNLPNTIMESMACGVPCVGFNVGGLPQMIDHLSDGYVAEYRNAADFAAGIEWALAQTDTQALGQKARSKVMSAFSEQSVAGRYVKLYKALSGKE